MREQRNNDGRVKHSLDTGFFNRVDSEKKAYWLGFIVADGTVSTNGRWRLKVGLAARDTLHLESLRKDLSSTAKISLEERKLGTAAEFSVYSKDLVESLNKYGVVPNKSAGMRLDLQNIPDELQRHFWRGVVDGDGSLGYTYRRNIYEVSLRVVGGKDLIEQFLSWSRPVTGGIHGVSKLSNKLYQTKIASKSGVDSIVKLLYTDAAVALPRKQEKAQEILQLIDLKNRSNLTWKEIHEQHTAKV